MTMTPEDAIKKLAELQTSEEIRRLFSDLGIKGILNWTNYCAIAEYAFRETGKRPTVQLVRGYFPSDHIFGNDGFTWRNTQAMRDFVRNFDNGAYPELIWEPDLLEGL